MISLIIIEDMKCGHVVIVSIDADYVYMMCMYLFHVLQGERGLQGKPGDPGPKGDLGERVSASQLHES